MYIAKLRISLKDASIQFNSASELGTDKTRGTVLADGKVVRGLGTHFASIAAKERFDRLTAESNRVRDRFNHAFMKLFSFDGAYVIAKANDAKDFLASLTIDSDVDVSVVEFELGAMGVGLGADEMLEWATKVKTQLERVQLGRGKEIKSDGLAALESLAACPALSKTTADAIKTLVGEVRVGNINKQDLQDSIAKLNVTMDQTILGGRIFEE
jgi:hypothetical protein